MSTLLAAQSLHVGMAFGTLFNGPSFTLRKGDHIGLIGYNGCGKSTPLKLLDGTILPTSGVIARASHCHLARVEQHLPDDILPLTLQEAVFAQLPEHERMTQQWRVEAPLAEMGFTPGSLSLTAQTLSGNQHARLPLAWALIRNPDLPLLDKPDNHLDLPTLSWLEQFLQNWSGSFMVVSHDPQLLNAVTHGTWILRDRTLHAFDLPCSAARQALEERDVSDALHHKAEQKEIDRVTASAERLAAQGRIYDNEDFSCRAKQMEKQVQRLKGVQTKVTSGSQWTLTLQGDALHADRLLEMTNLSVAPVPGANTLFSIAGIRLKSGDRVTIVGHNDCGKSSLLRLIQQQFQVQITSTSLVLHPRVTLGYYDQTLHQLADNDSLFGTPKAFAPQPEIRKVALISVGFPWARHAQRVNTLSGGERSRLLPVGLTLVCYSLLVLDEPTNHLDMEGKGALAETLQRYNGGVLPVSHGQQLISQGYNRFWLIDNGELNEWHDLEAVNARIRETSAEITAPKTMVVEKTEIGSDSDRLLEQLLDPKQCLADDLTRKPKRQKPLLQVQWRREIERLSTQLE